MRGDNREGSSARLNGDKEGVAREGERRGAGGGGAGTGKCAARGGSGTICRESYINYSDVICMLMRYICMSTRK